MPDHDVPTHQRWRDCAERTLAMARDSREAEVRQRLIKVARSYERMAMRAEDWTPSRESERSMRSNGRPCSELRQPRLSTPK